MKTFIIFAVIILIRIIAAAMKKKKPAIDETLRQKMAEQARNKHLTEAKANVRSLQNLQNMKRTVPNDEEYEVAYQEKENTTDIYRTDDDSNAHRAYEQRSEDVLTVSEHQEVSHFRKNVGLTAADHRASDIEFEQGSAQARGEADSRYTTDAFKKFIIAKEIFDKPKALKR